MRSELKELVHWSMMSFKIIGLVLAAFLSLSEAVSAQDTLKIKASLDTLKKEITGRVLYQLPRYPNLITFEFQLFPNVYSSPETPYLKWHFSSSNSTPANKVSGDMKIDSILLDQKNVSEYLKIDYTKGVLLIPGMKLNGKTVTIYFTTKIPALGDRLSYYNEDYLLDGWFPTPAILKEDGTWYHPYYGPLSELVGEYFQYDLSLTVPRSLMVITAVPSDSSRHDGLLICHHYSFGPAHDLALIISPDYLVDTLVVESIICRFFYHRYEQPALKVTKDAVTKTLKYMMNKVGPFRYKYLNLAFVDFGHFGGLEFPALVLLHSPRQNTMVSNLYPCLAIHEIVHQWFYGMIGSDQIETPWMDESTADYFTERILQTYWGRDANLYDFAGFEITGNDILRMSLKLSMTHSIINKPAYAFAGSADYWEAVYVRGALVMATLDNLMGDSLSGEFWRTYYNRFLFKCPSSDQFLRTVANIAGQKIRNTLENMLTGSGKIDYSVFDLTNRKADSAFEVSFILRREGGLDFPVDYMIILNNGKILNYQWNGIYDVERITFRLSHPAAEVIIDPEQKYAIDVNFLNNSIMATPDSRPISRLSSGIMFLIESLLSFAGGV
ncbi:MAG: M1 family aminopeptidase [candidate division Zixibacteria bacterium]|nr:M1 family aminopeptidase [candidate division Zixibacteria bacterium]